jgi:hypothetical protein
MRVVIPPVAHVIFMLFLPTPRILHPDKSGFQNDIYLSIAAIFHQCYTFKIEIKENREEINSS